MYSDTVIRSYCACVLTTKYKVSNGVSCTCLNAMSRLLTSLSSIGCVIVLNTNLWKPKRKQCCKYMYGYGIWGTSFQGTKGSKIYHIFCCCCFCCGYCCCCCCCVMNIFTFSLHVRARFATIHVKQQQTRELRICETIWFCSSWNRNQFLSKIFTIVCEIYDCVRSFVHFLDFLLSYKLCDIVMPECRMIFNVHGPI